MPAWDVLFGTSVPLLEIFVRGTVTFLMLTALMRVVGQRESGGLSITDVLIVVLIADAASAGLTGDASSISEGFLLVVTILLWSIVLDALAYRWPRLGRILKAKAKPLIEDGKLNRRAMRRELMSDDELWSQLRLHGLSQIEDVKRAYLEPNGMVSIVPVDGLETDDPPERPAP